jgi:hypothetical protein
VDVGSGEQNNALQIKLAVAWQLVWLWWGAIRRCCCCCRTLLLLLLLPQVRYLKVIEKTGYQALPWVRYITTAGNYEIRMN